MLCVQPYRQTDKDQRRGREAPGKRNGSCETRSGRTILGVAFDPPNCNMHTPKRGALMGTGHVHERFRWVFVARDNRERGS